MRAHVSVVRPTVGCRMCVWALATVWQVREGQGAAWVQMGSAFTGVCFAFFLFFLFCSFVSKFCFLNNFAVFDRIRLYIRLSFGHAFAVFGLSLSLSISFATPAESGRAAHATRRKPKLLWYCDSG